MPTTLALEGRPPVQQPCEKLFSHQPVSARHARRFVAATLARWKVDDRIDDVNVCVSELATNAMDHGSHDGSEFVVRVARLDERLRIEVRDRGGGNGKTPKVLDAAADDSEGRGLYLVTILADDWGVHRHEGAGSTVWAEFKVGASANNEVTTK